MQQVGLGGRTVVPYLRSHESIAYLADDVVCVEVKLMRQCEDLIGSQVFKESSLIMTSFQKEVVRIITGCMHVANHNPPIITGTMHQLWGI